MIKSIKENDYKPYMGILIDVRDPISYKEGHNPNSINIYYDKLLMNHKTMLDKSKNTILFVIKDIKVNKQSEYYHFTVMMSHM